MEESRSCSHFVVPTQSPPSHGSTTNTGVKSSSDREYNSHQFEYDRLLSSKDLRV